MTHAFTAALTAITLLLFIAVAGDRLPNDAGYQKDSNYAHNKALDHSKRIHK